MLIFLDLWAKMKRYKTALGRLIESIPFFGLGDSRQQNKNLQNEYKLFVKEYEELGHMVVANAIGQCKYYLRNHAILRSRS